MIRRKRRGWSWRRSEDMRKQAQGSRVKQEMRMQWWLGPQNHHSPTLIIVPHASSSICQFCHSTHTSTYNSTYNLYYYYRSCYVGRAVQVIKSFIIVILLHLIQIYYISWDFESKFNCQSNRFIENFFKSRERYNQTI